MWTDLAIATDDRRELSSLVQPGMRAVSVRAGTDQGFALVRPGDRVDVFATMPQGDQRSSILLLQNILVLAVGLDTGAGDPSAKQPYGDRSDQITLSLHVPEAQLLELAAEKGRLTVGVRGRDDLRIIEGVKDINSSMLTDPTRGGVQNVRMGPVPLDGKGNRP